MIQRLQNLQQCVSVFEFWKLVICLILLVALPLMISVKTGAVSPGFLGLVSFGLAWTIRNWLVQNAATVLQTLRIAFFVLILGYIATRFAKVSLPNWAGPGFFVVFGAYVGCYFWVVSDPRIAWAIATHREEA